MELAFYITLRVVVNAILIYILYRLLWKSKEARPRKDDVR